MSTLRCYGSNRTPFIYHVFAFVRYVISELSWACKMNPLYYYCLKISCSLTLFFNFIIFVRVQEFKCVFARGPFIYYCNFPRKITFSYIWLSCSCHTSSAPGNYWFHCLCISQELIRQLRARKQSNHFFLQKPFNSKELIRQVDK